MREIKFRGKTVENKWCYGSLLNTKYFTFICKAISKSKTRNYNIENLETIGQYTGLKDKNGQEIYEGDIIELDEWGREYYGTKTELAKRYQLVGFKHGNFMTGRNKLNYKEFDSYLWILNEHSIVVGNIYDNPELLEKE